nr:FecR domain-containing protein [FCB group bacterium]
MIKSILTIALISFCLINIPSSLCAQDSGEITVRVEENQSLRKIAEQYLGDPDLWQDILRANGLQSAVEVKAGMILKIPVKAITRAKKELDGSLKNIQNADKAGAKIFAVALIDSAISLRNQAIEKRHDGDWSGSYNTAREASSLAKKAFQLCEAGQNQPAQAKINHEEGTVQSRTIDDLIWKDAPVESKLIEGEKVRTLSKSLAEIMFKDESRLRLGENSQALIQLMRINLLENKTKSKVNLIEGDIYALLGGEKTPEEFQLEVKGVETEVKSSRFRVSKDEESTRFANYQGEFGITSAGKKVVIKENQGSVVKPNQPPSKPKNLLKPVELISPPEGTEIYDAKTELTWQALAGAKRYLVEIAKDNSFNKVVYSQKNNGLNKIGIPQLNPDIYYWRVSGIDKDDLTGSFSSCNSFRFIVDNQPPYLTVISPQKDGIVYNPNITVSGGTEIDADLYLNGKKLTVNSSGAFSSALILQEGENKIKMTASDKAGNKTEITRTITYQSAGGLELVITEPKIKNSSGGYLIQKNSFTLAGIVPPGIMIEIESSSGEGFSASAVGDKTGEFKINLQLKGDSGEYIIHLKSPAGETAQIPLRVIKDDIPPKISFKQNIPSTVGKASIVIEGQLIDGVKLYCNGSEIPLQNGMFIYKADLKSGRNSINVRGIDSACNETVIEKEIIFDDQPPKLIKYEVSPKNI